MTKPDIIERPAIDFSQRLKVTLETRTLMRNGVPTKERRESSFPAGNAGYQHIANHPFRSLED